MLAWQIWNAKSNCQFGMPTAPSSGLSCHIWHASYHWLRASCHLWHASFQLPSVLLVLPNRNANCQPKNWQASISSSDESFSTQSSMVRNAAPPALAALSSQRRTRCGRGTRRGVNQTPKYLYSITTSNSPSPIQNHYVEGLPCGRPSLWISLHWSWSHSQLRSHEGLARRYSSMSRINNEIHRGLRVYPWSTPLLTGIVLVVAWEMDIVAVAES